MAKAEITKLGVLGGTFDPPHIGHLLLAQTAFENYNLDKILFIPAARLPHKHQKAVAPVKTRLEMLRLALDEDNRFEISDIEIKRPGLSYTSDTLEKLQALYPKAKFYLIIGGDNISDMQTWKNPENIFALARGVASLRPNSRPDGVYRDRVEIFNMPQVDISSTMIRQFVKRGKSVKYMVTDKVEQFIRRHGLYL